MSRVAFSKLGLKKNEKIETIKFNDVDIEVKQYLPTEEKFKLIERVLSNSNDDNNFKNPMKVNIFTDLEIIFAYTNLTFTDKQKEDVQKLYDLLDENGVIESVIKAIPQYEYTNLISAISETIDSYYKYRNSALGILEIISKDYSDFNVDLDKIQEKLSSDEFSLLKEVITKLD